MLTQRPVPSGEGRRIVICDYNALLQSVTGLLRMSGFYVFQAHDGLAAQELCVQLPRIALLILNTYGTGIDIGGLIRDAREAKPNLPVLHIGCSIPDGLPDDVPTLAEGFTPDQLLMTVDALIERRLIPRAKSDPLEHVFSPRKHPKNEDVNHAAFGVVRETTEKHDREAKAQVTYARWKPKD